MKSTSKFMLAAALIAALSASAFAQEKFTVAGGGGAKNGSVYSSMIGTLAGVCSTDELQIEEKTTKGGVENLELIKGNKVKAAVIPSDVLAAAKFDNASSVAQIQTLFTLHMEAAHLIVRGDAKKEGGVSLGIIKNLGGSEVTFNNPEDLKNRQIGVVGGSAVTARIISDMLRFGWQLKTLDSTSELLAELTSGKIDAALISAGLQSDAVKAIKGNFKLLPLRGNSDTANVYKAVKVEYSNLNGGRAVDTLGARALLVTRTWKSEEVIASLSKLRTCFQKNLGKIQDTTGVHAAWEGVDAEDRGPWQWYSLPDAQAAAAPGKKK